MSSASRDSKLLGAAVPLPPDVRDASPHAVAARLERARHYTDWLRQLPPEVASASTDRPIRPTAHLIQYDLIDPNNDLQLDEYVLHLPRVADAKVTIDSGLGKHRSGQGDITLSPPGELTTYRGPESRYKLDVLTFSPQLLREATEATDFHVPALDVLHSRSFRDPRLEQMMSMMVQSGSGPTSGIQLDALLHMVIAQLLEIADKPVPAAPKHARLLPAAVRKVEDYLRAHLVRGPALQELALLVGYSPFHFSRLYKSATGTTPHERLVQLRLDCAKDRLKSQLHLTIAAIAQACGFSDHAHLTRLFKKHLGLTPSGFRREALA